MPFRLHIDSPNANMNKFPNHDWNYRCQFLFFLFVEQKRYHVLFFFEWQSLRADDFKLNKYNNHLRADAIRKQLLIDFWFWNNSWQLAWFGFNPPPSTYCKPARFQTFLSWQSRTFAHAENADLSHVPSVEIYDHMSLIRLLSIQTQLRTKKRTFSDDKDSPRIIQPTLLWWMFQSCFAKHYKIQNIQVLLCVLIVQYTDKT